MKDVSKALLRKTRIASFVVVAAFSLNATPAAALQPAPLLVEVCTAHPAAKACKWAFTAGFCLGFAAGTYFSQEIEELCVSLYPPLPPYTPPVSVEPPTEDDDEGCEIEFFWCIQDAELARDNRVVDCGLRNVPFTFECDLCVAAADLRRGADQDRCSQRFEECVGHFDTNLSWPNHIWAVAE